MLQRQEKTANYCLVVLKQQTYNTRILTEKWKQYFGRQSVYCNILSYTQPQYHQHYYGKSNALKRWILAWQKGLNSTSINHSFMFTALFAPDNTFNSEIEESRAPVTIAGSLAADGAGAPEHAGVNGALNQDPLKGRHRGICVTDFHVHGGYCGWIKTSGENNADNYLLWTATWNELQGLLWRQTVTTRPPGNYTTLLHKGTEMEILSSKPSLLTTLLVSYVVDETYKTSQVETMRSLHLLLSRETHRCVSPLWVL